MSILSSKETAANLATLLMAEGEFDYEQYQSAVKDYTSALFHEMRGKINNRTTRERLTSLLREYCQRFDGVVHRVEQTVNDPDRPLFPLFRGGLFCFFISMMMKSPQLNLILPDLEYAAKHLPYGDSRILQSLLNSARKEVAVVKASAEDKVIQEITDLLSEVKTRDQLKHATLKASNIILKAGNSPRLLMHLYHEIGSRALVLDLESAVKFT